MLKKMLLALAAPKHVAATEGAGVERRPGPERMGRAFMELIERISAKDLPKVGGRDATIVVTIDLDTLLGRLREGQRPRHRGTHQPRRCPQTRLHRPDHPRRPRRQRARSSTSAARSRLFTEPNRRRWPSETAAASPRMRLATLAVPRTPLETCSTDGGSHRNTANVGLLALYAGLGARPHRVRGWCTSRVARSAAS